MTKVFKLGDTHLGKQFINGVPLHRRGQREAMVWLDFMDKLKVKCDLHVQVGDLFDGFIVPPEVVIRAYNLYSCAASENPDTQYVIVCGNHDASRNADRSSSFDLFRVLCARIPNIHVISGHADFLKINGEEFGFCPWHPFYTSEEIANGLQGTNCKMVVGHWDTSPFNGDSSNTIPFEVLKKITKHVVTGHIHLPTNFKAHGMEIEVVGSMQPYSHSEDATGRLYQTFSIESIPEDVKNLNVRILAKRGDEIPDLDCLSLTVKYVEETDDVNDISVEFQDFDMNVLFSECLTEQGVSEKVALAVQSRFKELRK